MFNKKIITISFLFLGVLLYFGFFSLSNKISAATNPTVLTVGASDITESSVTLTGNITDDGDSIIVARYFEYGETVAYELTDGVFIGDDPFGLPTGEYSESVGGLEGCGITYHYRAWARNEDGFTGYGEDMTFDTPDCPLPTVITTLPATNIGLNSATLNASIDFTEDPIPTRGFNISGTNPNGGLLDYHYQEEGSFDVGPFSLTMNNLSCSTTYTYDANNGQEVTFDTLSCDPPVVTTGPATLIEEPIVRTPLEKIFALFVSFANADPGDTVVQLNGSIIDTGGEDPVAGFEYGLDTSYGNTLEVGTFGVEPYSTDLVALDFDTTYHYRAYASNSAATSYGEDQTFMIESPIITPSVNTNEATSIRKNNAILNGEIINTGGENATVRGFEYGLTDSYGSDIEESGSFSNGSFTLNLLDLSCNTLYHYRAYATNTEDTGYGDDQSFTTNECQTSGGYIPIDTVPIPVDICPNIDGVQENLPTDMKLDENKNCVQINIRNNPIIDLCPNINGNQNNIPINMTKKENGNCVFIDRPDDEVVDFCLNIDDVQKTIPDNMEVDNQGNCFIPNIIDYSPIDKCNNIEGIQEVIPEDMEIDSDGNCILSYRAEEEKEFDFYLAGFILSLVGLLTGVYVGLFKNIFAGPIAFNEIKFIPIKTWNSLLAFLGIKKNKVPWGTVYDSVTKQPIDPAYIILKDLAGNEIATSITDLDGRYGFLVPAGQYKVFVNKTNYKFPSEKLGRQFSDAIYQNLYHGEIIDVVDGEIITKNIPLDPIGFDWNEFEKKDKKLMKFFSQKQLWISRILDILFYLGAFMTIVSVILSPITYNIIILVIYIVLYIFRKFILKERAYGSIKERINNNPLSFAVIRLFFPGSENEVAHKVADKTGKYYCLVANGTYYAKIENKNTDESYSLVHTSGLIKITKGYINKEFKI